MSGNTIRVLGSLKFRGRAQTSRGKFLLSWHTGNIAGGLRSFVADARILAANQGKPPKGSWFTVKEDKRDCDIEIMKAGAGGTYRTIQFSFSRLMDSFTVIPATKRVERAKVDVANAKEIIFQSRAITFSSSEVSSFFDDFRFITAPSQGLCGGAYTGLPVNRKPKVLRTKNPLQEIRFELSENADPIFWLVVKPAVYDFLRAKEITHPFLCLTRDLGRKEIA